MVGEAFLAFGSVVVECSGSPRSEGLGKAGAAFLRAGDEETAGLIPAVHPRSVLWASIEVREEEVVMEASNGGETEDLESLILLSIKRNRQMMEDRTSARSKGQAAKMTACNINTVTRRSSGM